MNQFEREEQQLENDLNEGLISQAEYNKQIRDMQRDYQAEMRELAQEHAERAYSDAMGY